MRLEPRTYGHGYESRPSALNLIECHLEESSSHRLNYFPYLALTTSTSLKPWNKTNSYLLCEAFTDLTRFIIHCSVSNIAGTLPSRQANTCYPVPVNIVDLLLVVVILLSVIYGWRRGFILGVLDLLGWALVLIAALRFYQPLAKFLEARLSLWSEIWNRPIAFTLIAITVGVLVQVAAHTLLSRLPKQTHERTVNRIFGLLPGVASGVITAALVAALLRRSFYENASELPRKLNCQRLASAHT